MIPKTFKCSMKTLKRTIFADQILTSHLSGIHLDFRQPHLAMIIAEMHSVLNRRRLTSHASPGTIFDWASSLFHAVPP